MSKEKMDPVKVRRHAQLLFEAVERRHANDIRDAFRNAVKAKLDTEDLAEAANIILGSRGLAVQFQDQPGNRWLITTFCGSTPQDRIVVF